MFDATLLARATALLELLRTQHLTLITAESCTGGLIAGLFTEIAGASDVIDRGFVTYSNAAKMALLGVPEATLASAGAVSRETALAMADGALARAGANSAGSIAIAVTGVAGPGGGSPEKPVGLVHIAAARTGHTTRHRECRFGPIGRHEIRIATVAAALELIAETLA